MPGIAGLGAATQIALSGAGRKAPANALTDEQQREVERLADRDREVRQHEQAHLSAAAGYGRGPTYTFTRGPDGKQYATGGEVQIDTAPARTPEQTIVKAQVIRRAALAPVEPSGQDRAVAAAAARLESEARRQIAEQSRTELGNRERPGNALSAYAETQDSGSRVGAFNQTA